MNIKGLKVYRLLAAAIFTSATLLMISSTSAQTLYEADQGSGNIYQFTPNGTQSIFASNLVEPTALAFDKSGNLYDGDLATGKDALGSIGCKLINIPTPGIFLSGLTDPVGLAFDQSGDLFLTNIRTNIVEVTPSGSQHVILPLSGVDFPIGLAFDRGGNLFIADYGYGTIIEYSAGVSNTLTSGLSNPYALAFDGSTNLYVSNYGNGVITKVTPSGSQSPFYSGLSNPEGLAFNSAGNLFVCVGGNSIVKITPGGQESPFEALAFQPLPQLQAAAAGNSCVVTVAMTSPYFSTVLQASTNLFNWSSIATNIPPFTYTDSITALQPHRFYRAYVGP